MTVREWITPEEAVPHTPWKSRGNIYERIREGKFPFEFKRSGRSILISARSLGLITDTQKEETRKQVETLASAA